MTKRIKSIFKNEEVFKTMGRKSVILLSISVFLLILAVSALRLVDHASAEQLTLAARINRFQRCENNAGAGFFWVDTTNGKTWYWSWPENGLVDNGQPEESETGKIGTYMPCANNNGGGMFMVKTTTGEAWWVGYKQDWQALSPGRPEMVKPGEVGSYMPCEKELYGGLYVVNTKTGSGWWTPSSDKEEIVTLDNPDARAGDTGTYICHRNKDGAGLYILNTATGQFRWTDGKKMIWHLPSKGKAEKGAIGTYAFHENKDGAGIFIMNTRTGEGLWTSGSETGDRIETSRIKRDTSADRMAFMQKELGPDVPQQIKLEIKSSGPGKIYGTMALDNQAVSMENLVDMLQKYDLNQKQMLIIISDRGVQHHQIVKVMDIFKKAGIDKIGFALASL